MRRAIQFMDDDRVRELLGDAAVDAMAKAHEELYIHTHKLGDGRSRTASINLLASLLAMDIAIHTKPCPLTARAVAKDVLVDVIEMVDGLKRRSLEREKGQSANLRKTQKE